MKAISALLVPVIVLGLTSCTTNPNGTTAVGMVGSPFWLKTASPEVIAEHYGKQCEAYGYTRGTDAMAACIQQEVGDKRQSNAARGAEIQAGIKQAYDRPQPTYTRCSRYGNTASCYSY